MKLHVYGASDDLIEVEGDIREEWALGEDDAVLAFSDGTVLGVDYDHDGIWRFNQLAAGTLTYHKTEAFSDEGRREGGPLDGFSNYSDVITLDGDAEVTWIVYGKRWMKP